MQILALISALATIFLGGWVAFRLLGLARRSGERPERVIGIGMLAFAGIAYPLFLVGVFADGRLPREFELIVLLGAHLGYLTCLVSLALFTRIVFRPGANWSLIAVIAMTVLEAGGAVLSLSHAFAHPGGSNYAYAEVRWSGAMISSAFALLFLWTSIEALVYRSALRKRLALGLTDPIVVNRMSVWAIGTGIAAVVDLSLAVCNGIGLDPGRSAIPALLQSASGLSCSLTWMLTFAPTEAYLDWVRRRASAAERS